jgi:hypothetical protein
MKHYKRRLLNNDMRSWIIENIVAIVTLTLLPDDAELV